MNSTYHFLLSAVLTAFINLSLVFFVIIRAPNSPLSKRFMWYGSSIVVWSIFLFFYSWVKNPSISFLCAQLLHIGSIFIPCFFFHFVLTYLGLISSKHRIFLKSAYLLSICFLIIDVFFPHLLISRVIPKLGFNNFMDPGPIYHYWIVLFFIIVIYAHVLLFRSACITEGELKSQRLFFFIGNFLGYLGGVGVFSPVYNNTMLPFPYGGYGVVLFSIVTVYTIVKFRFMDIEVIIKKTLVFTGLFAVVMIAVGVTSSIIESLIGQYIIFSKELTGSISVLLAIILYEPIRKIIVNLSDKFLFQKKFDYRKLLKDASMGLSKINSLKHQLKLISHFLTMRARIKSVSIFMPYTDSEKFIARERRNLPAVDKPVVIEKKSEIYKYLKKNKRKQFIRVDEIEELIQKDRTSGVPLESDYNKLKIEMNSVSASLIIASYYQNDLKGLLVLGERKSEEEYSEADINIFTAIAQESAMAIENARLFDEKVQRTLELEKMNMELGRINGELGQSNDQLRETQASLIVAEKNATMVGMAKAIGHEVYNPLCTVEGRTDLLRRKLNQILPDFLKFINKEKGDEEVVKDKEIFDKMFDYVDRIEKSARRIKVAVQTLTNILKESKGEMTPLNFLVLWKESVQATRFSTYDENLSFCDFYEEIKANLLINGNLEQLMQVFTNLIKNAYEAMSEQKERQISIKADVDPEDNKMARIEFKDSGPGMTVETQRKIFQQGFSTKNAKDKGIGTSGQGQGLYICKHIIESVHKGSLTVESEMGKGTRFTIRIPLMEEEVTPVEKVA